jgi:hypothetical protein
MAGQPGFFDQGERLKALSAAGDPLERLVQVIDFEVAVERGMANVEPVAQGKILAREVGPLS